VGCAESAAHRGGLAATGASPPAAVAWLVGRHPRTSSCWPSHRHALIQRPNMTMIATAVGLAVCYFLFAGQFSTQELLSAGVACCAALGFAAIVHRTAERRFECARCAWVCARVMAAVAAQAWVVAGVLCRAIWRRPSGAVGTLRQQPFVHGQDSPTDAGRRAAVTLARSVAPEEFVLDIPEHGDWLLVHTLCRWRPIKDRQWPV